MWGGRFDKGTDPLVEIFSRSIQYDHKLAEYDVLGSLAHVRILKKAGYLSPAEASKLTGALNKLYGFISKGAYKYDTSCEDIHTDIQNKLYDSVGDLALKLHTARSRNDQVVFSVKLYCKAELGSLVIAASGLVDSMNKAARKAKDMVLPGFTHMQHAQPIYLKDYFKAYSLMLSRDVARLITINNGIVPTMGSGALAGTPIPAQSYKTTIDGIGVKPCVNSLYTVSDRDFVMEILAALSIVGVHISRFAEDLIIWSTKEFDFIEIDEAFCTGSSLMPQKKNADSLELIRGNTGRLFGNLVSVLTMMKALPLSYNRDMQCDKEPLFSSIELVKAELGILTGLVSTLSFNKEKIEAHLEDESLYATDLVYYLVDKGVPFKTAHTVVGRLIKYSIDNGIDIKSMSDAELCKFSVKLDRGEMLRLFDPMVSVKAKRSIDRKRAA